MRVFLCLEMDNLLTHTCCLRWLTITLLFCYNNRGKITKKFGSRKGPFYYRFYCYRGQSYDVFCRVLSFLQKRVNLGKPHYIGIFWHRRELYVRNEDTFHLPRHYEVCELGEAHKLGITETNVQEKNACFTTQRKI